jgi:hypothetical protein
LRSVVAGGVLSDGAAAGLATRSANSDLALAYATRGARLCYKNF